MKDETAHLHDNDTAAQATGAAVREPTVVHLPLFRPGTRVQYNGQSYTVGHVIVSRDHLRVFLTELGHAVEADKVRLAPTRLVLQRQGGPLGSLV